MYTIQQIKEAHSKVKSGADFPNYIAEIKQLGVSTYEVFVEDGRTDYYGSNGLKTSANAKYKTLAIAETSNSIKFKLDLTAHQQGNTNYITFCGDCAALGIEKWVVNMQQMTCVYYDKLGNEILAESIPTT